MIVAPLASGSAGNCYFFESDGTRILVDAGLGPRETQKRLQSIGRSIDLIEAILVTHEHYDHVRGAEKISRKFRIPLFMTKGTLEGSSIDSTDLNVRTFENDSEFRIGNVLVHARRTVHDANDSACFVIEAVDGTRAGLASDLGCIEKPLLDDLHNCDALFFEANHDLDMLRSGTYPWSLKRRIMSRFGHLSNDDAMLAVERLIGPDTKTVCLIHLSEKNNHESIVRSMASSLIQRLGAEVQLQIAKQSESIGELAVARTSPRVASPRLSQLSLF